MLHPTATEMAKIFTGYDSVAGTKEGEEQFQAEVTYDPEKFVKGDKTTHPKNGSVKRDKEGILYLYWEPSEECPGCEVDAEGRSYAYLYEGWYRVPTNEEIEDYCLGETAFTPSEEQEVEPDHPDSWPRMLGLI